MESILTSIKLALGITEECKDFDGPIIMHINTVLMTLTQIGVGPEKGYMITSEMNTWENFLGYSVNSGSISLYSTTEDEDPVYVEAVKTYVYLKVKMVFDPPTNSAFLESMKRQADEIEWRLTIQNSNN